MAGGPAAGYPCATSTHHIQDTLTMLTTRALPVIAAAAALLAGAALPASAASAPLADTGTTRIQGADRYATATAVSASTFTPPQDVVFVASGENYPDALAAGPAAASADAPILLVKKDSVPTDVVTELERLKPSHVVVVGGSGVVSDETMHQLASYATTSERVFGANRYETAEQILAGMGAVDSVYLSSGAGFADALGGGAAAAAEGGGLLVTTKETRPDPTLRARQATPPSHVVILGGTGVVSAAVEAQVTALLPSATVDRAGGDDRFETAGILAEALWGESGAPAAFVASGMGYADALAATPVAYVNDAPILLTKAGCTPAVTDVVLNDLAPDLTVYLGGPAVSYSGTKVC
jgi:putative cell wall-binding protein